jgi:hypothetical protein
MFCFNALQKAALVCVVVVAQVSACTLIVPVVSDDAALPAIYRLIAASKFSGDIKMIYTRAVSCMTWFVYFAVAFNQNGEGCEFFAKRSSKP